MTDSLVIAAETLLKREQPQLVAAMGLIFQRLYEIAEQSSIEQALESYRGGIWGKETTAGSGFPVLRSTNMRGVRVDVAEPAWCDISSSQAESCTLKTGDILVIKSSGSNDLVGKAALFIHPLDNNTYLFSNFVMRLKANKNIVLSDFLAWFLRSPQSLMWRYKTQQNAVGLRNLDTKAFLEQSIPLPSLDIQQAIIRYLYTLEEGKMAVSDLEIPPSLNEQHRIVARIEELAAKIEEARGLRLEAAEEADEFLSKTLSDAFKPHHDKMVLIGDVFKVTTGSTPSRGNPLYWGGEIKWVSSGEVAFCRISNTSEKITELGLSNSSAKVYPPNTVLLAMIGQGKTRGQVAILDCYAATNQNVAGIHVYETAHIPEYVYWWLRSRYYESRLAETGTAQPALSGERVKQMPIPLPSVDEQFRIVKYLDAIQIKIDALKQLQFETSAELDALLPAILDRAFKGEL